MAKAKAECAMLTDNIFHLYPFASRTWMGDSGASCFTTNPTGIYDTEPMNESIEAANVLIMETIKDKKDVITQQVVGQKSCYMRSGQLLQAVQSEYIFSVNSAVNEWKSQ